MLESGDFIPFVKLLLSSEFYLEMCYYPDAIMCAKNHRVDLLSVLDLMQQLRFELGYLRANQKNDGQRDKFELSMLKKMTKHIIEAFAAKNALQFEDVGDETKNPKLCSFIRKQFCSLMESLANNGMHFKSGNSSGTWHIWHIVLLMQRYIQSMPNPTSQQILFSSAVDLVTYKIKNVKDRTLLDSVRFKAFVCYLLKYVYFIFLLIVS